MLNLCPGVAALGSADSDEQKLLPKVPLAVLGKAELDAAGAAKMDETLTAMNERIRESMQAIAETLAAQEEMTPELGFRLMGDLSATLADTYDALGEVAGAAHRAEVSKLTLVDFVDPMVAEPLIAVQDKLEHPVRLAPRGGRGR